MIWLRAIAAALLVTSLLALMGCKAEQARAQLEQSEQVLGQVQSVKATVDTVLQKVEAGTQTASGALEMLRQQLPDGWPERIDEYLANGHSALQTLVSISALTDEVLVDLDAQIQQLKADIADKQASDDVTMEMVGAAVNLIINLLPVFGLGGVAVGVPAAIVAKRRGQRVGRIEGEVAGAQAAASTVAVGRGASSTFDHAFEDEDAGKAMRTSLASQPEHIRMAVMSKRKAVTA